MSRRGATVAWIGLAALAGCQLQVDFDPGGSGVTDATDATDSTVTADTSEPTVPTVPLPGTSCTSTAEPWSPPVEISAPLTVLSDGWQAPDEPVHTLVVYLVSESLELTRGPGSRLEITQVSESGAPWVGVGVENGVAVLFSGCQAEVCPASTLQVAVPEPLTVVAGAAVLGPVTIRGAVSGDIHLDSLLADVVVSGAPRSVRVASQEGALGLDLAGTQVLDAFSATGDITLEGDVTGELCAEVGLGTLELELDRAGDVYLRTSVGLVQGELAQRPARTDVQTAQGDVSLTLPAGGYQLDTSVGPQGAVLLNGIEHDPGASERIRVQTSAATVTLGGG